MPTDKMNALIYKGKNKIVFEKLPIPEIGSGEALIKIAYSGICGTDMNILSGKHPRAKAPLIMGHEFSGTIAKLKGEQRKDLYVGQKVTAMPLISCGHCTPCRTGYPHVCQNLGLYGVDKNGGFAEYIKVPQEIIFPLPKGVSLKTGVLVEPLAVAVHAINRAKLNLGDSALVLGCGPIGLLLGFLLKNIGINNVYATDINSFRLAMANKIGMEPINPMPTDVTKYIFEKTNGEGVDVAFEAAGVPETIKIIVQNVRVHGHIMLIGAHKKPPNIDIRNAVFKELLFLTSRVYTHNDFLVALNILATPKGKAISSIATHEYPLQKGSEAFTVANDRTKNSIKVLIKP